MFDFSNLFNAILSIAVIAGSIGAYKYGFRHTVGEVQQRVISALSVQLNDIRAQLSDVKRENSRLSNTLSTIIAALAKSGIYITIDGSMLTIENSHDGSVHVTRITEEH